MSTFVTTAPLASPVLNKLSTITPIVLTIAGSDSGGGAGIQADIKAISATGGYACSVITALTAQNTQGVTGIYSISSEFVEQQLDAVFSDLNVIAVKVGMLSDSDVIHSVAKKIKQYSPQYVVVDPVMVATSGDLLLQASAIDSLKSELLPLADVITPNLPEASALIGVKVPKNEGEMTAIIDELRQLGAKSVLLKGGHLEESTNSTDLFIGADSVERLSAARINTHNTHGTGCTLSSAIASYLAQGYELHAAVRLGKEYITQAIVHADELIIGKGHGPVNHFFDRNKAI
ncbi:MULTISPECIES: bifunctional hydroxymethylpyrimidine kinase/phosphomethylpyrimidine kinase [Aliivibrio]|uniref:hydroxymethylpyrimidine kinase n=1 Tax=Aliivibrio finisterrensis TaxID=511998 RepID=A0A4Q5KX42_9GAMM|nr:MULTISPECIES: bifunctional hydroxymethylpyrimidine kinase/phosphomethylpyrimidine kinase [Aliivibrio]MDD9178068.1 bifunctional hydroxymethylpyrimidine kinase/phosphomethylpyrimidine kinase [Aliivibrio sp. A6]RYU53646.1 bifunctional hydroxymethylpyrimidine kinase/phosphomethylpyrimidine kinase [Aliivibrio finisterrensis]RYU54310.1 bifunctional hydroxymethylpyrimidine kinase/phosphomethylpyrimidine kinase [Aliivibrio finisterrensis]RYU59290.1 bifunctional hydroxymethylpyrimidine kinase/phospho